MSVTFFFVFSPLLPWTALADKTATCYSPNGAATAYTGGALQIALHACPAGTDGFATCCAEGDTCSPDRLCYNPGSNNVWRNFCTDPTWKSGSCSPLCRGTDEWNSGPVQITPCQDGMMCCGANNTQCCSTHAGAYAFTGVPINATSTPSSPRLTPGEIGGIAVGAVGSLLLAAVLVLLALRFRNDRRHAKPPALEYAQDVRAPTVGSTSTTRLGPPSLWSQPSVKISHALQTHPAEQRPYPRERPKRAPSRGQGPGHGQSGYGGEMERPLPALPRMPAHVHELGGGEGVSRFEVSGGNVWEGKKYQTG